MADKPLDLIIDAWCRAGKSEEEEELNDDEVCVDTFRVKIKWSQYGIADKMGWEVGWPTGKEGKPPKVVGYTESENQWVIRKNYKLIKSKCKLPKRPPHRSRNEVKPH